MATDTAPLPVSAPRRLWQLPTFVLGLVAVWAAATGVTPPPDASARYTSRLDDLAAALDRKPPDASEVEPLVRLLADAPNQTPRSHYILGSAYNMLAGLKPTESSDLWKLALLHFDACDAAAMTPQEMALLTFRSAVAKAAVGSSDPAVLIAAIMNAPPGEDRSECPRLIAECALRLPQPDLGRARDELTSYLGGPNRAAPVMADRYRLMLADLNRKLNDPERAKLWLKAISSTAPPDVLVPAKLALAQQAAAERNWAEAVALYEAAQSVPGIPTGEKGSIRYQIADAMMKLGNGVQAAAYYEQASREPGAIGAQASLRLAEMRALDPTGRGKRGEAVDWLERAVVMLPAEAITENERKTAESLVRVCLAEEDFTNAVRAADAFSRISPKNADLQLRADINQHWGMALQKAGDPGAKVKFRIAADCSLALAGTMIADQDRAAVLKQAAFLQRQAGDGAAALQTINMLLKSGALDAAAKAALHVQRSELLPPTDFAGIRESLEIAMGQSGPAANAARLKLALLHVNRGQDLVVTIQGSLNPDAVRKEAEQTGQFGRDLLAQVADMANVPAESRAVQEQSLFELGRAELARQQVHRCRIALQEATEPLSERPLCGLRPALARLLAAAAGPRQRVRQEAAARGRAGLSEAADAIARYLPAHLWRNLDGEHAAGARRRCRGGADGEELDDEVSGKAGGVGGGQTALLCVSEDRDAGAGRGEPHAGPDGGGLRRAAEDGLSE